MRYQAPDAEQREAFHQGKDHRAYQMLGAHPVKQQGEDMWHFAVWAPNAKAVSVTGEFCAWSQDAYPMQKQYDGIWELRLPASLFDVKSNPERYDYEGAEERLTTYKYAILTPQGEWHMRPDPYAFRSELRPNTASRLYKLDGFRWHDKEWMEKRAAWDARRSPVNIYELHLGSWRRKGSTKDGSGAGGGDGEMMTYDEIAKELVPYIKEMGYTHVELMPVMEHPLDMSWGYQVTGYYAATARYGEPKAFMRFVDKLHAAGIGVILDWVPAHFPKDEAGLRRYDGTALYEHADPRRSEMKQWGTLLFDYARGEARSFLISNACYWLGVFHADGLRVDAVSGMLYLDFCREAGDFVPNAEGGNINHDAVKFIQDLNTTVYREYPGVMMVAEEATSYPGVTAPVHDGGLGFGFKWNMGWMNDMLAYVKEDPINRKYYHNKLTFSLMYAFSENYILPFSHDEVVHGKKSMCDKQPGDLWQKFAGLRALYGYTMAHPGKKLLFMGSEFGQIIEWRYDDQLDWFLLLYDKHPQMKECVRRLNEFYRATPALYQVDDSWNGFEWLEADDADRSVAAFDRTDRDGNSIVCITNFTPVFYPDYQLGFPQGGVLEEVLNTDREEFGGSNQYNAFAVQIKKEPYKNHAYSARICLPPLSSVYFTWKRATEDTGTDKKI